MSSFDKAVAFIRSIGIPVQFHPIAIGSPGEESFLPGLIIENGALLIDTAKLKYPGDVLHEAGHLAVVPAAERATLNGAAIAERPNRETEEMMAIAWSYAACLHLQIDPHFVFHNEGYLKGGNSIVENFNNGLYFGVPMLQWIGLTTEKKKGQLQDGPFYPEMSKWVRD
jgi:hypothetical protein